MEMSSSYFKSKTELFILFFIALKKLEASQYQRIFFSSNFRFFGRKGCFRGRSPYSSALGLLKGHKVYCRTIVLLIP